MENFIIENGVLIQYKGKRNSPVIPDGIKEIGILAFNRHISLKSIVIPDSVTEIDNSAFCGCPGMTVYANKGSYAERYAKENNIKFKAI